MYSGSWRAQRATAPPAPRLPSKEEGDAPGKATFAPGGGRGKGWILGCDYDGEQGATTDDLLKQRAFRQPGGRAGAGGRHVPTSKLF